MTTTPRTLILVTDLVGGDWYADAADLRAAMDRLGWTVYSAFGGRREVEAPAVTREPESSSDDPYTALCEAVRPTLPADGDIVTHRLVWTAGRWTLDEDGAVVGDVA